MFLGRRRRSREESPKWICESRCCQVVFVYMYLRDVFALKPFHDYSLCSVCILPQPAFYSQSAVCILHAVCILPLVRNLQSAVRSLLVKKFYLFTVHFSTAPLRNFEKGRMCYLWPRLCRNLSFLLHSVSRSRLGVVVGGNFNPAQDVLISCIHCWTQTLFIFAVYTFGM